MQQWTVVIDWVDGDVEDSDECSVYAASSDEAISMAREIWQRTYGSQWPSCEIAAATALGKYTTLEGGGGLQRGDCALPKTGDISPQHGRAGEYRLLAGAWIYPAGHH
jgi:hypothetical protein